MSKTSINMQMALLVLILLLEVNAVLSYKRNYEAKYTKANVPLWKQRACEKAQKYKANSHYVCDDIGDVKCLPGWQGDLCQVPMCRKGCDPMNGYCQRPGECRCRIGYTGELCDKCIPLPGCQHGDCTKPFECICRPGWDGLFCTEPSCRPGCHNTRGYCDSPGECRCRIGWAGRNCSDCSVLPGCQHGTCTKPLDCQCLPGYTGLLCQTPICNADCHKQHGYCKKPGECRCKVGWIGPNCDKCFPYPGCVNGDCKMPWECNCKPGWGGILCDEKLTYCVENPDICENKGKCTSLTKDDGSYRCHCKQGYFGKNCEIVDEFLLTSTAAPRITPPPLANWYQEEDEDYSANLNNDNQLQNSKEIVQDLVNLNQNDTLLEFNNSKLVVNMSNSVEAKNVTLRLSVDNVLENVTKVNSSELLENMVSFKKNPTNFVTDKNVENNTAEALGSVVQMPVIVTQIRENNISSSNSTTSVTLLNSTASSSPTTASTKFPIVSGHNTTTMSPLNKLDDEKYLLDIPVTQPVSNINKKPEKEDDDDDDDEECTDDNDDECEYVYEDEDDFK